MMGCVQCCVSRSICRIMNHDVVSSVHRLLGGALFWVKGAISAVRKKKENERSEKRNTRDLQSFETKSTQTSKKNCTHLSTVLLY
jgi:hypothetical protein